MYFAYFLRIYCILNYCNIKLKPFNCFLFLFDTSILYIYKYIDNPFEVDHKIVLPREINLEIVDSYVGHVADPKSQIVLKTNMYGNFEAIYF